MPAKNPGRQCLLDIVLAKAGFPFSEERFINFVQVNRKLETARGKSLLKIAYMTFVILKSPFFSVILVIYSDLIE